MSRLNYGRYQPEPVTEAEHRALKDELLVMVIRVVVVILATFAEPLMDALEMLVTR